MGADRVHEVADAALGVVADYFAAQLPDPIALPARQFVSNGPIAFDCEQLVVEVVRLFSGTTGAERVPERCVMLNAAEMRVWLLRCVPAAEKNQPIPTVEELTASGEMILTDLWLVTQALARAGKAEAIERAGLIVTGAAPIQPQGAIGGSLVTLQVTL